MSTADERQIKGERMRRQVMSDAYVDARQGSTTPFSADLEAVITQFAWGEIWTRPGLDPKIRSVVTLVLTASRSQWDEFRIHVRGAINNGLTVDELREVLLHAGAYGGLPVARTGFREAEAVLRDMRAEGVLQTP